jgi:hypothetical protein
VPPKQATFSREGFGVVSSSSPFVVAEARQFPLPPQTLFMLVRVKSTSTVFENDSFLIILLSFFIFDFLDVIN